MRKQWNKPSLVNISNNEINSFTGFASPNEYYGLCGKDLDTSATNSGYCNTYLISKNTWSASAMSTFCTSTNIVNSSAMACS